MCVGRYAAEAQPTRNACSATFPPATHSGGMRPLQSCTSQHAVICASVFYACCRIPLECLCVNSFSRHFARTALPLRPHCIPAYTHLIPSGITTLSIRRCHKSHNSEYFQCSPGLLPWAVGLRGFLSTLAWRRHAHICWIENLWRSVESGWVNGDGFGGD